MSRKPKQYFWSGCEKCNLLQKRNEEQSNENWSVFDCNHPCPKCGKIMSLNMGEPPENATKEEDYKGEK